MKSLYALLLSSVAASATAIEQGYQDAIAASRGNAFAATADNASAVYYNPAGLAWQDRAELRSFVLLADADISHTGSAGSVSSNTGLLSAGALYAVYPMNSIPATLGFGINTPYGLGTRYPDDSPLRTLGIDAELAHVTFTSAISWKLTDRLSIGLGVIAAHSDLDVEQGLSPIPGGTLSYKADGNGVGWTGSLLYRPNDRHSFALNYRSSLKVDLKGNIKTNVDFGPFPPFTTSSRNTFDYPEQVVLGYAYRPNADWLFEVNAQWSDWRSFQQFSLPNDVLPLPPQIQDYQPGWVLNFGMARRLSDTLTLNAGYLFGEETVPDRGVTPIVPDGDLHNFSLGLEKTLNDWSITAGVIYGIRKTRTVTGSNPDAFGVSSNGKFKVSGTTGLISFSRRF